MECRGGLCSPPLLYSPPVTLRFLGANDPKGTAACTCLYVDVHVHVNVWMRRCTCANVHVHVMGKGQRESQS
jgi:hypothetical protein